MAWNEWCPPERRHGFDYWTAYGTYDYHLRPLYWSRDAGRNEFYYVDQWGPEYEAGLAIQYLDSIKDKKEPFAMMVSMNPPHTGYELVPERYKKMYRNLNVDSIVASKPHLKSAKKKYVDLFKNSIADYYACITGVDEQFGRIVDALKAAGLYDNTIVVFVSDHGDSMGMHENIGKNIFYEEAMRVPFLIAYGEKLKPRQDNELLISLEDFCPTILSMMGLRERIPESVQTRDLSKQIQGSRRNLPDSQLYMQYSAVNKTGKNLTTGARGIRNERYTYAVYFKDGKITAEYLFDRKADPYQMNNIAASEPKIKKKMVRTLVKRMEKIEDPATKTVQQTK